VERHNGIFGGGWCTYFHPDCAERERAGSDFVRAPRRVDGMRRRFGTPVRARSLPT
jgi:hypothetical protein